MISFLFEEYGYYPKEFSNNKFFINDWEFRLVEVDCNNVYLEEVERYIYYLRGNFGGRGPYIMKNKSNSKISTYDGKKYVLVSVNVKNDVDTGEFNKMHVLFNEAKQHVNLEELLKTWQMRFAEIERYGVSSLRMDSPFYSENLEIAMFGLGMCQNAIQYLYDIIEDCGKNVENVAIVHKRIDNFNSFDFFNPFNLVVDHPIRDYAELYRNDVIGLEELVYCLNFYEIDCKIASLFIARIMYPIKILDLLDDELMVEKNIKQEYSIPKEIIKIKKAYVYFKNKYNIRPIDWLEI